MFGVLFDREGAVHNLWSTRNWENVHGYRGHFAARVPQAGLQDSGEIFVCEMIAASR